MKPDGRFEKQPKHFWANVRTLSQQVGYTDKKTRQICVPTFDQMREAFQVLDLEYHHVVDAQGEPTSFGILLSNYFTHRASVLNTLVEPSLMNAEQARELFDALKSKLNPTCPIPMNKQSGEMKVTAYLTGIINMLVEASAQGMPCNFDPQSLTTVTFNKMPLRTLARRVDGAFPSTVNPIAVWEVKEYYFTTTFGSRVADGVYETLLDGLELEELREAEKIDVKHYLMVDAYYTWWVKGKSYLCRIIDMLHMGYVDEVLFGKEVADRLPSLVLEWVEIARQSR